MPYFNQPTSDYWSTTSISTSKLTLKSANQLSASSTHMTPLKDHLPTNLTTAVLDQRFPPTITTLCRVLSHTIVPSGALSRKQHGRYTFVTFCPYESQSFRSPMTKTESVAADFTQSMKQSSMNIWHLRLADDRSRHLVDAVGYRVSADQRRVKTRWRTGIAMARRWVKTVVSDLNVEIRTD